MKNIFTAHDWFISNREYYLEKFECNISINYNYPYITRGKNIIYDTNWKIVYINEYDTKYVFHNKIRKLWFFFSIMLLIHFFSKESVIKREERKLRILANTRFLHITVLQWTIIVNLILKSFKFIMKWLKIWKNYAALMQLNLKVISKYI